MAVALIVFLSAMLYGQPQERLGETVAPPEARKAVQDYVEYAVERNAREAGFFKQKFGVDAPDRDSLSLGEPFPIRLLKREGLERFVSDKTSTLVTYAEPNGFIFPLQIRGKIVAAISTSQLPEGRWHFGFLYPSRAQLVDIIREAYGTDNDLVYLQIRRMGYFVAELHDTVPTRIVSLGGFFGDGAKREPGTRSTSQSMEWREAERVLRTHAERILSER